MRLRGKGDAEQTVQNKAAPDQETLRFILSPNLPFFKNEKCTDQQKFQIQHVIFYGRKMTFTSKANTISQPSPKVMLLITNTFPPIILKVG